MHEYDIALKLLLRESSQLAMREIAGEMPKWINVELPEMQNTRVDLLGELAGGRLIHIELQSRNDSKMALRMAEYCLRVYRLFGRLPKQIVLYVGNEPSRMSTELTDGDDVFFRYQLLDSRDLDGEALLESDQPGDNVIAVLARLQDRVGSVSRIVAKLARLEPSARDHYLRLLLIMAGLRRLEDVVEREARKVPILDEDILENRVLGRVFRRGHEEGVQQGMQQGELTVLERQIAVRFGSLPAWAHTKLSGLTAPALADLSVHLLTANSLEDLLS